MNLRKKDLDLLTEQLGLHALTTRSKIALLREVISRKSLQEKLLNGLPDVGASGIVNLRWLKEIFIPSLKYQSDSEVLRSFKHHRIFFTSEYWRRQGLSSQFEKRKTEAHQCLEIIDSRINHLEKKLNGESQPKVKVKISEYKTIKSNIEVRLQSGHFRILTDAVRDVAKAMSISERKVWRAWRST